MRLAMLAGVHDTGAVTSVYHRWEDAESSLNAVPIPVWNASRRMVLQRLDAAPLLLPPGSASRLGDRLERTLNLTTGLRTEIAAVRARVHELEHETRKLEKVAQEAQRDADEIRNATLWKVTRPLRRLLDLIRGRPRRRS